jgi:hypothetical protein
LNTVHAEEKSYPAAEYLRPWKLFSLACGLALLLYGAATMHIADWDAGVSIIMAVLAYLTAPWVAHIVVERRWRQLPLAFFWTLFTVDGSYVWYHVTTGTPMYREANFPASLALYFLCAAIWYARKALKDFLPDTMPSGKNRPGP